MSRSTKHSGWCKQGKHRKPAKRCASRAVRRADDVADGNHYKRYFCSWDISDYRIPARERDEDETAYRDWMK